MLAAQMDLTETVLRRAGRLQQNLVQRRVAALRNGLQRLGREAVNASAKAWLNLLARNIELA